MRKFTGTQPTINTKVDGGAPNGWYATREPKDYYSFRDTVTKCIYGMTIVPSGHEALSFVQVDGLDLLRKEVFKSGTVLGTRRFGSLNNPAPIYVLESDADVLEFVCAEHDTLTPNDLHLRIITESAIGEYEAVLIKGHGGFVMSTGRSPSLFIDENGNAYKWPTITPVSAPEKEYDRINAWLRSHDANWDTNQPYFSPTGLSGPQEIVVHENGDWEASYEGHGEGSNGHGLTTLQWTFEPMPVKAN